MINIGFLPLGRIREKVRSLFYQYGLFCSTHQLSIMMFAILSVLFVIYPLKDIPFLGNTPQTYESLSHGYRPPTDDRKTPGSPRWYTGSAIGYVQQIIVRSTIAPWDSKIVHSTDALKTPLHKVFAMLKFVNNLQVIIENRTVSMADVCLRISEPEASVKGQDLLPHFDCMIFSPANVWKSQEETFLNDDEFLRTIYSTSSYSYEAVPKPRDIFFGIPWLETGLSKYFIRNRQRIVQFAITIVYKAYNESFIQALTDKLMNEFPLSLANKPSPSVITHVSYRESGTSYLVDYTPLIAAYLILFLYIYFSVQKIEMVKSKWGLALSAVVTVVLSLLMSISICAVFGVTPSVSSSEIFPYLVVVIGLENVLVLTRSVVRTPINLEVKYRIALGLQEEGWLILKNLLTELIILFLGFLTFVPAIQEFCLFASIGLLVDFYLQMVFFATILSIDIRRLELSDLERHTYVHINNQGSSDVLARNHMPVDDHDNHDTSEQAPVKEGFIVSSLLNLPKRMILMNFVANFRIVQRLIMLCTVAWIGVVLYKTGIISSIVNSVAWSHESAKIPYFSLEIQDSKLPEKVRSMLNDTVMQPSVAAVLYQEPSMIANWKRLSLLHWPGVFSLYNKSIIGTYISFLPAIKLSLLIPAEKVNGYSHVDSDYSQYTEPDSEDFEEANELPDNSFLRKIGLQLSAFSTTEKIIAILVSVLFLILLVWLLSLLYSVMCRKDYAKWRKKAGMKGHSNRMVFYNQLLDEVTRCNMIGENQPIECLVSTSDIAVTSDLLGDVRVWNVSSGECRCKISRREVMRTTNADDDFKIQQQHGASSHQFFDRAICQRSINSADVINFDLSQFVDTRFHKMEKQSFSDCLKQIEQVRAHQAVQMSSISAHKAHPSDTTKRDLSSHSSYSSLSSAPMSPVIELSRLVDDEPFVAPSNIWCLDVTPEGLIIAGCSDGSLEFWDAYVGNCKCKYKLNRSNGVASMKYSHLNTHCYQNLRVIVAGRMDGYVDFVEMTIRNISANVHSSTSYAQACKDYGRIHTCRNPAMSLKDMEIQCNTLYSIKAHQSSVGLLEITSGRVLTACDDKVINVYSLENGDPQSILRGHQESIMLIQGDDATATALTASVDGMIRLWDVILGTCLHKLSGLIGPVLNLQMSNSFVAASSLGSVICIWDKSNGRMLHSIHKTNSSYSGAIAIIGDLLLVSGGRDALHFWDLESGLFVQSLELGSKNKIEGVSKLLFTNCNTLIATVGADLHSIIFQNQSNGKI